MIGPEQDEPRGSEVSKVQLDLYGIKVSVTPVGEDEDDLESWREVASAVNANLRSITVGIFRLVKVTVQSATRLVRGIGELPGAIAGRVQGAHEKLDTREEAKQLKAAESLAEKEDALRRIKEILDRKSVEGLSVRMFSDGNRTVICILKPTDEEVIEEIAHASLKAGKEQKALAESIEPNG